VEEHLISVEKLNKSPTKKVQSAEAKPQQVEMASTECGLLPKVVVLPTAQFGYSSLRQIYILILKKLKLKNSFLINKGKVTLDIITSFDGSEIYGVSDCTLAAFCQLIFNENFCKEEFESEFTEVYPFFFKYAAENIVNTRIAGELIGNLVAKVIYSPIILDDLEIHFKHKYFSLDTSQQQKMGGTGKGPHNCGLCGVCNHKRGRANIIKQSVMNNFVKKSFENIENWKKDEKRFTDAVVAPDVGSLPMFNDQFQRSYDIAMKESSNAFNGLKFTTSGALGSGATKDKVKNLVLKHGGQFINDRKKKTSSIINIVSLNTASKLLNPNEKSAKKTEHLPNTNLYGLRVLFALINSEKVDLNKYLITEQSIKQYENIVCEHELDSTINGINYDPAFLESLYEELLRLGTLNNDIPRAMDLYKEFLRTCSISIDNLHVIKGLSKRILTILIELKWLNKDDLEKACKKKISRMKGFHFRNLNSGYGTILDCLTTKGEEKKVKLEIMYKNLCELQFLAYSNRHFQKQKGWRVRFWLVSFLFARHLEMVFEDDVSKVISLYVHGATYHFPEMYEVCALSIFSSEQFEAANKYLNSIRTNNHKNSCLKNWMHMKWDANKVKKYLPGSRSGEVVQPLYKWRKTHKFEDVSIDVNEESLALIAKLKSLKYKEGEDWIIYDTTITFPLSEACKEMFNKGLD
jgi:hypothetical protein